MKRFVSPLALWLLRALACADEMAVASGPPVPDKSRFTLFNPTPVALWRAFNVDRPTKGDSPITVDAGAFLVEADVVNWTLDRNNVERADIRVRTWLFGQLNLKVGLTNWMDFEVLPPAFLERRTSGSDFGPALRQHGLGDTTVRFKFNLLGNDSGNLALGFIASLKIPTNSEHLGNSVYEPGFVLPFSVSLPAGFLFFGQSRIDLLDRVRSNERRAVWSNPIGVSRTIFGPVTGYVEFYNAVSSGEGYPWVGTADVGLIYQVTPNFSVDLSSFFGLTRSADDLNIFAGFAHRF